MRPARLLLAALLLALAACLPAAATVPAPPSPGPTSAPASATPKTPTPAPSHTPEPSATPPPTTTPNPQAGARSAGDPYAPDLGNGGIDVLHYDLTLRLDPRTTFVEGSAALTIRADLHNLVEFSLDFIGFEIRSLTLDGAPAAYEREGAKLIVYPDPALSFDQEFILHAAYAGVPVQEGSPFIPFFHHLGLQFLGGSLFAYSQPDAARNWFPANDHPTDKATFSFAVTVPDGLIAVANGEPSGQESESGWTTFYWEEDDPMATYLATVAAGAYVQVESVSPGGIPLRHYIFPDRRAEFEAAASISGEALDWMADQFGPYPFDSFGFAMTRTIRASLETQSTALLSELMLNEETVIHEIAHMWFGNWVTMASWADMWHNEGLAVYLSLMWQTRANPGSLDAFMANLQARAEREGSADPLGNLSEHRLFGFDSYQRGALLMHALRKQVGEEAFFGALRLYLERHGGGVATRDDFIAVFEEVSEQDLDAVFSAWLE